jgi:membrane-bound lytic murein transglycosylase B
MTPVDAMTYCLKPIVLMLLLTAAPVFSGPAATATQSDRPVFEPLQKRLMADGFDQTLVSALYENPQVGFESKDVSRFFLHSESRLNYNQFVTQKSILTAQDYINVYRDELERAQAQYGVDKEIIAAIILVETRLGTRMGKSSVFNVLSTMAALEDRHLRNRLWIALPEKNRYSRKKFEAKADKKSKWAYAELKALIRYTSKERIDPTSISGSYAGALGICQFMPSNIFRLAVDQNQDGKVDLFDHDDAIGSVANYLRHYGWRPEIDEKKAYKIILRYNYSKPYAKTILKIAQLLKN